jgi:hypothetical protein
MTLWIVEHYFKDVLGAILCAQKVNAFPNVFSILCDELIRFLSFNFLKERFMKHLIIVDRVRQELVIRLQVGTVNDKLLTVSDHHEVSLFEVPFQELHFKQFL